VELIGGKKSRRWSRKARSDNRAPSQNLISLSNLGSHVTESYRLLRTNLDFAALDRPVRKMLVTSALPREGKSTTAANLAVVTAQSGKRVLLLDLDLRRPTVHKLFKVPNHHGLTSLLLGVARPEEAIQEVGIENLEVLTSGPLPPSPADTLSSQALGNLLDSLAERYDLVISDSPPVLVASDAVILASRMDGALVVVAANSTSKRVCKHALESLQRSASPILGVVLNMLHQKGAHSFYYYDYQAAPQGEKPKQVPV
jgi:capsular exopolysaccharide synthesis family protein